MESFPYQFDILKISCNTRINEYLTVHEMISVVTHE